jgi:hypothetical protein
MRTAHVLALALIATTLGVGAWLGCSSSSSTPAEAPDAGPDVTEDLPASDAPAPDTAPPDTEALNCDNYCARVLANCTGDAAQYADLDTCKKICADLPLGDSGDTASNTVACRFYHAGAPAQQSRTFHCPHAGPFGGDTCGTRCGAFCLLAGAQCGQAFTDAGSCDAACGSTFKFSNAPEAGGESPTGPSTGNTLNCREYHLVQAFGSAGTECANIGKTPPADSGVAFPCR